jgi:hypothetical protein
MASISDYNDSSNENTTQQYTDNEGSAIKEY